MANLAWGKPKIRITKLGGTETPIVIPTPVEGSTQLTTTKGATREAPLEGGGFEDKAYNRNTYVFEFEIYAAKGREKPVEDVDGVIEGQYKIELQPEDPTVEGIIINKCILSVEDTYSAEIGKKWKYTADVLVPDGEGESISYEVVTFSSTTSSST
jgi:hypothetical protein